MTPALIAILEKVALSRGEEFVTAALEKLHHAPAAAPGDDPVNHPSHYTSHPSGVECIQITEHMGFCVGNAIKYMWRTGLKGDTPGQWLEDLKKARWYIDREVARLTAEVAAQNAPK